MTVWKTAKIKSGSSMRRNRFGKGCRSEPEVKEDQERDQVGWSHISISMRIFFQQGPRLAMPLLSQVNSVQSDANSPGDMNGVD